MLLGILFFGCLGGGLAGIKDKQELFGEISPPALEIHNAKAIQKMCGQRLDHFDKQNNKTWCQRYVVNASLHQTGGPIFICIDGEDYPWNSGRRPYTLACNNMVELAQGFGAMMLGLEHRYYGGAAFDGVPNFSTANLKYLSSRQALADLAQFHDFMTEQLGTAPWVVFGGSYPGALSAWARKLYPEKFLASVASSAPLLAQANFVGYNDVVASALTAPTVGGTPECLEIYSTGHQEAVELMKTSQGRRALEKKFKLCGHDVLENSENFAYWAGQDGIVATVPQYNSPLCEHSSCNVRLFCGNLTRLRASATSALDGLQLMSEFQDFETVERGGHVEECRDIDYEEQVKKWSATEKVPGTDPRAGDQFMRLWEYQTCTEFGWYQTCETGTNCPYAQGFNVLQWNLDLCKLLFGIEPAEVMANMAATNRFYGGSSFPNATQVIFPNGEVDPWHWESCLVSPEPSVDTLFVKGASHCEWMHAVKSGMTESLILAKQAIQNRIASWLPTAPKAAAVKIEQQQPHVTSDKKKISRHEDVKSSKFLIREDVDMASYLQLSEL